MIIKVTSASNIIGFPLRFIGFADKPKTFLEDGVAEVQSFIDDEIIPNINSKCAEGWTLTFCLVFTFSTFSGVNKRGINYPSGMEKEFSIVIPIPSNKISRWGVATSEKPSSTNEERFITITFDYNDYTNAKDFIVDCAKRSLMEAFRVGITIAGKKIKFTHVPETVNKTFFVIRRPDLGPQNG